MQRRIRAFVIASSLSVSLACGGGGGSSGGQPSTKVPTGLSAVAADGQVTLRWDPVAGATRYNVYVALAPVAKTNVDSLAGGRRHLAATSPFLVSGLTNYHPWHFAVTAVTEAGESAEAVVAAIPRQPGPTEVFASPGDGAVTLTWTAVPGAWQYRIYSSSAAGVSKDTVSGLPDGATSLTTSTIHTTNGLVNGRTYHFVVAAMVTAPDAPVGSGETGDSYEVAVTPAAGATACLTLDAVNVEHTKARLRGSILNPVGTTTRVWFEHGATASYGAATAPVSYSQSGGIEIFADVPGLPDAQPRHFRIVAQNAAGTCHGPDRAFTTWRAPEVLTTDVYGVLTNDVYGAAAMVLDATHVYWAEPARGLVRRVPKIPGGAPTNVASMEPTSLPRVVAVDAQYVYVVADVSGGKALLKAPAGGGDFVVVAAGLPQVLDCTVTPDHFYWVTDFGHSIRRVALDGGAPETFLSSSAEEPPIAVLRVDSGSLYFMRGAYTWRLPIAGGAEPAVVFTGSPVLVRDGFMYYVAPGTGYDTGDILYRVAAAGGAPVKITNLTLGAGFGPTRPHLAAADDAGFYWSVLDVGTPKPYIYRVDLAGGPVVQAAYATDMSLRGTGIELDATHLYWILDGTPICEIVGTTPVCSPPRGGIYRLAKP